MTDTVLYIVVPCYNEEKVLPITAPMFCQKLEDLTAQGVISPDSRVLFVDDGSSDGTWALIQSRGGLWRAEQPEDGYLFQTFYRRELLPLSLRHGGGGGL